MMSSDAAAAAAIPPFNLCVPTRPEAVYSYIDEEGESTGWLPHPDLPAGIRGRLVAAVDALPREWLMAPKDGEIFDSVQSGQNRVLGYSLAAGFQSVGGQGSSAVRKNIWCIHHGNLTRNDRKLSERVERDSESPKTIISTRKREDTGKWGKKCLWRCYLVPCQVFQEDGDSVQHWILRYGKTQGTALPTNTHSHELTADSLVYPRHRNAQPHHQAALPQAGAMRAAQLSFRQAERVLWGQQLKIDRKTYYNIARQQAMPMTQDGLMSLIAVLEQDNWTYRSFWEYIRTPTSAVAGEVTARVLKAVFFTNDALIKLARKFTPDWMIQVDGTFNTNRIRMPLIDCLGVTNCGKSFLFAFCFVTSESSDNWGFALDCLASTVFEGLPLPRVVIADQGLGLRSCFSDIWPHCQLQFCEWHAAENVRRRLAAQRYKKDEREVIMDLVWSYIWSATEQELEVKRTAMKAAMRLADQEYIDKHWVPKERQVIRVYTSKYANLNCFSSQREEGQHPVVKTVLNSQLRLDEAVRRLAIEMNLAVERLYEFEQVDKVRNRRVLEANVWYRIRDNVASWPLITCEKQWNILSQMKLSNQPLDECICTINQRFGLPCYHDLEYAWDESIPLPLTMIHSRWWYAADIDFRSSWKPTYADSHQLATVANLDRPRHEIVLSTNQLLEFRETLTTEQQQLLDRDYAASNARVLQNAQAQQYWATAVPSILPAPLQSTWNRHANSHDKANKRMLTGAEAATRDANKAEEQAEAEVRAIAARAAEAVAIDEAIWAEDKATQAAQASSDSDSDVAEVLFTTPISPPRQASMLPPARPLTPVVEASRKRTLTLVDRTPEKPRAPPTIPEVHTEPAKAQEEVASTAPARLDGRPRREGKNREYNRAMAIERGPGRGRRGGKT
jgi:hypothetical protein